MHHQEDSSLVGLCVCVIHATLKMYSILTVTATQRYVSKCRVGGFDNPSDKFCFTSVKQTPKLC